MFDYGDLTSFVRSKGGPKSGNFGHDGRPGKVGGSASRSSAGVAAPAVDFGELSDGAAWNKLADVYKAKEQCAASPPDCAAAKTYSSDDYEIINERLRHNPDYMTFSDRQKAERTIEGVDRFLDNAPRVPQDMKVFRGVGKGFVEGTLSKMSVGDSLQDKAYTSTSVSRDVVRRSFVSSGGAVIELDIPKGSKGAFVRDISVFKAEQEILLPRNSRYTLKEIKKGAGPKGADVYVMGMSS